MIGPAPLLPLAVLMVEELIAAGGRIAPAAFVVLLVDNQLDRALERLAEPVAQRLLMNHAIDFGQEERAEAMPIHGTMPSARAAEEIAASIILVEHITQAAR